MVHADLKQLLQKEAAEASYLCNAAVCERIRQQFGLDLLQQACILLTCKAVVCIVQLCMGGCQSRLLGEACSKV